MITQSLPPAASADHLTTALRNSGMLGDGCVRDVVVERSFDTLLSHIFRLKLSYDATLGGPEFLILKAGLADRPGGPWKAGRQEVAFYTEVASAMSDHLVPRCFDADWTADTGAWHLLLEDLTASHAVATRWPLPPTLAQCESIVRARARFHAAWWDDPRLGNTIGSWQDAALDQQLLDFARDLEGFTERFGDRLSFERRDLYARLIDRAPRLQMRYRSHRNMTILQGDSHVWNCFLPRAGASDDALLFDWDAWHIGPASNDLSYMMALHWYPDRRRQVERPLLDCHHAALEAHGVKGYARRELDDDYRQSVLWNLRTPVWQEANGIPPVVWWNGLERILMAVDDLDCRELLG
ncbi:MAG TPA: aminoglycoside phosphotransferase [Bradyrhizobium sp.]|jgi:hypothetical protein|nr:aminoglycoside phosphotransferase [Bradyrhizobium sp.]